MSGIKKFRVSSTTVVVYAACVGGSKKVSGARCVFVRILIMYFLLCTSMLEQCLVTSCRMASKVIERMPLISQRNGYEL